MAHAGDKLSEELTEKISKTVQEVSKLEVKVKLASNFVDNLQGLPDLFQNKLLDTTDLLSQIGDCDDYISSAFLPHVMVKARESGCSDDSGGDKLPGRAILKHAFFELKMEEDALTKAKQRHSNAQRKLSLHTQSVQQRLSKKRKAAEIECAKIINRDQVDKEVALARRNQLNRKRRKIAMDKIKKIRCEDALPEARGEIECFVEQLHHLLQGPSYIVDSFCKIPLLYVCMICVSVDNSYVI